MRSNQTAARGLQILLFGYISGFLQLIPTPVLNSLFTILSPVLILTGLYIVSAK